MASPMDGLERFWLAVRRALPPPEITFTGLPIHDGGTGTQANQVPCRWRVSYLHAIVACVHPMPWITHVDDANR